MLDAASVGFVDWREFVLLLAFPRWPTLEELWRLKRLFIELDVSGNGRVRRTGSFSFACLFVCLNFFFFILFA